MKASGLQEILSGQEYDWLFDPKKLHDKIREAACCRIGEVSSIQDYIKEPESVVKSEVSDAEAGQEGKSVSSIPEGAPVAAVDTEAE